MAIKGCTTKIFVILFISFISHKCCYNTTGGNSLKHKTEVIISEFISPDYDCHLSIDTLFVLFTIGIEQEHSFTIYLDQNEIKSFKGKTNESIDVCECARDEFCLISILHNDLNENSKLKVEVDNQFFEIEFPQDVKKYNKLYISKSGSWRASFQRVDEDEDWE